MPNEIREFNSFMDFALGFNSVRGDIRGQAITRTPAAPAPGDGQTVTFHARSVTSIADIQKALAVSAEASAVFLGGGGSASFDFSENSNFHSFSAFLLVTSFVTNASTHMLNEQLRDGTPDAPGPKALIAAGLMDRFTEEFGDFYIKGIETGGKFFAIIEVQTSDSTDQTNVATSLSVNAFVGGAESLNAHFKSAQMQSLSTHKLEINSLQIGGQGDGAKQFLTADEMLNAASNFAKTVFDHPVHFRVELQDYQSLDLPPPPNAADIQNAKDVIADCATLRATWLQFRNDIAFILANPAQFEPPQTDLSALDDKGADALNLINRAASRCLNNLKDCQFVSTPPPDRSKLPKRKAGVLNHDITVPDVLEEDASLAQATLEALGLRCIVTIQAVPGLLSHFVGSQDPPAGSSVPAGATVTLVVAP